VNGGHEENIDAVNDMAVDSQILLLPQLVSSRLVSSRLVYSLLLVIAAFACLI